MTEREFVTKIPSKDGTLIACWRNGQGPPLVLVHGTTADHSRWTPVLRALRERFSVYAVDRRGRGESGDAKEYAIEREFEDIAGVVDSIEEPVNLLGHSYGALCSLGASLLTHNLRKLILYEPPIPVGIEIYSPVTMNRIETLLDKGDRDGAVTTFMLEIAKVRPQDLELLRSLPAWAARVAAAHTSLREMKASEAYRFRPEQFRRLSIPALLLVGGDSPMFLKRASEVLNRALPTSQIAVLLGQQHAAMDTGTQLFLGEVLRFLEKP